jgi:hypothetical protein
VKKSQSLSNWNAIIHATNLLTGGFARAATRGWMSSSARTAPPTIPLESSARMMTFNAEAIAR